MTNLFAYRATDPKIMLKHENPEGPDNDKWLREIASGAVKIIAAWGVNGFHRAASSHIFTVLDLPDRGRIECLRRTKSGAPSHPLYLPYEIEPQPYE